MGEGVLYNFIFTEWRHCVSQNNYKKNKSNNKKNKNNNKKSKNNNKNNNKEINPN